MRRNKTYKVHLPLLAVMLLIFSFTLQVYSQDTTETPEQKNARMEWWRDARFGLFIHWGIYSVPAGVWKGKRNYAEWIRNDAQIPLKVYEKFVNQFDPVKFDAEKWVQMAKDAGMKYIVITSKHHDGFCMFNSKYTDFDIMSTPYKKDVLKELADAAHKAGIKICFYYSIMDWHNYNYLPRRNWETNRPTKGANFALYVQYMKNQLHELLTNYGKIGILWFDGEWEKNWNNKYGQEIYDYVRKLQPDIIVNNRVGTTRNGMEGFSKNHKMIGDYGTPEQQIPATGLPGVDWETCMTMNDHWGYNKHDNDWKSAKELIRNLTDIASKGGNYLLNIGPTAEGVFPPPAVERLKEIGKWMKVNGESIYGTKASPFENLTWGRCTQKEIDGNTRLYLHVFDWPQDGKLIVPGISNNPKEAYLLSDSNETQLSIEKKGDGLVITLPQTTPDSINSVVVLDVVGKPDVYNPPKISARYNIFTDTLNVHTIAERKNADIRYTTDGTIPTAESPLASNDIVLTKSATVTARCFLGENPVSAPESAKFEKVDVNPSKEIANTKHGIKYSYYEGTWDSLPDFNNLKPLSSGIMKNVEIIKKSKVINHYGFQFSGYIQVPADGVYKFYTSSDDGSCLYVDGNLVVNNDGHHADQEKDGVIALAKGFHSLQITYYQGGGNRDLKIYYEGPGLTKQIIPNSILFY
jgi:alpha-L-fucosidase